MAAWLSEPTRFAALRPIPARLILLLLAIIFAASAITPPTPTKKASGDPEKRAEERADLILYETIVARVRGGEDYYHAAAAELRAGNYPLRPFVAVRLPTLAWLQAALPPAALRALMLGLVAAVVAAWAFALRPAFARPPPLVVALLLLVCGLALLGQAELIVFHEAWAALLIALSLGLWGCGRTTAAILVGLAAALVRETALPFLVAMGGLALLERRWRETAGWTAAAVAFGAVLLLHAQAVAAVTSASDPASPGWDSLGGWRFALTAMRLTTATRFAPEWLGSLIVALALFGWAAWRAPLALRALGALLAYVALLSLFGRPDNFYWGMLTAPILLVGLAFAAPGLADLVRAASTSPERRRKSPAR